MRGINKVILVGTLGRDPETRSFAGGGTMTTTSLATSEKWKDKNSGEWTESTEWHRVVFNGKLAEIAAEYLRKGSKVYVEGKLTTRKWKGQDGVEKFSTEIRADQMQMLDDKKDSEPAAPRQSRQAPAAQPVDDFSDDLPF